MKKNKRILIVIGISLVMIFGGLGEYLHLKAKPKIFHKVAVSTIIKSNSSQIILPPPTPTPDTASTTVTAITLASSTPPILTTRPKAKQPIPSYGDVVLFYQYRRIQFNQDCQAIPSQQVFANGVQIMLDNRSPQTQKITMDGKIYNVAGYNYVFAILKEKKTPVTFSIACNGQMNTGQITVE